MKLLRVLSDPLRLRLLLVLSDEELTVAELQEVLGLGQSRISTALAQLRTESLVSDRRVGRNIFYSGTTETDGLAGRVLDEARASLEEAAADRERLAFTLRKRKDKAAEYFNRLAGKFGRTHVPGRSWQALAHALLRLMPPMTIADMGAGEGTLSQLLATTARKVIAIDNSEKMVEFGSALAREHGFRNLEYRLGDIEDPPIADGEVDLALFSQALHHAAVPQRAVKAAWRILKPGGRIMVLDLLAHTHERTRELYGHVWLGFQEIELQRMLRKAGFTKVESSIVSRGREAPHFQTILATGSKPPAGSG